MEKRPRSKPHPLIELTCTVCGDRYKRKPSQLAYVKEPVCSRVCHGKRTLKRAGRSPALTLTCCVCRETFRRYGSNLHVEPADATCSIECRDARRRKLSTKPARAVPTVWIRTPTEVIVFPDFTEWDEIPLGVGTMARGAA